MRQRQASQPEQEHCRPRRHRGIGVLAVLALSLLTASTGCVEHPFLIQPPSLRGITIPLPPPSFADEVLISIDVEGYVWLVDTFSNGAYKFDPQNPSSYTRVNGLNQPYTYSDMTGFALNQVGFPPQG
ncbi:MAG: hypothetical protein KC457_35245 [Myxococcales bacterium]|nr:hypothetical protein [Myxococcales bacterium]